MQEEFDFNSAPEFPDGLSAWHRQRETQLAALAQANGLPLGRLCRVELGGHREFEGILRLAKDELFLDQPIRDLDLRLQVGSRQFTPREVVSIVRLD